MRTNLQNYSSLPPAVQKLSPKRSIFASFKTITLNYTVFGSFKTITLKHTVNWFFQDHYIRLYSIFVRIRNLLSRPSYEHRYSFQQLNFHEMLKLAHFKTIGISLITALWQAVSSYSSHPSSTGTQRTSNLSSRSGEARSPWPLKHPASTGTYGSCQS